jgi:hypothetical protein
MNTSQQTPPAFNFDQNAALAPLRKALPEAGTEWPREARQMWLKILEEMFDVMYKANPTNERSPRSRARTCQLAFYHATI